MKVDVAHGGAGERFRLQGDSDAVAACLQRLVAQGWRVLTEPVEEHAGLWSMRVVRPAPTERDSAWR